MKKSKDYTLATLFFVFSLAFIMSGGISACKSVFTDQEYIDDIEQAAAECEYKMGDYQITINVDNPMAVKYIITDNGRPVATITASEDPVLDNAILKDNL